MGTKKVRKSRWEKQPDHGWKTVHKIRQDPDGDVIEEVSGSRAAVVAFFASWGLCVAGWWWQAGLDGWFRGVVLTLIAILTIYLVVITAWLLATQRFSRFIRDV